MDAPNRKWSITRDEFERCWPFLEPAIDHFGKTHGKEDVWVLIESGRQRFAPLGQSAIVGNIERSPAGVVTASTWLVGGNLYEIKDWLPTLHAWAKNKGCHRSLIRCARRQWLHVLEPEGYRELGVQIAKDLTE